MEKTLLGAIPPLCCPVDGTPLQQEAGAWKCTSCSRRYPANGLVVSLLEAADGFYEGAYLNRVRFVPRRDRWPWIAPLWLISNGYLWAVRRFVPAGSVVLELGCAGGVAYFARRYRMLGADVSRSSLELAASDYAQCIQLDATRRLPFPDASIDAVVSSYFWEHMLASDKSKILTELFRILRPGGHVVFLYDVATANGFIRALRNRDGKRYQELFLDQDGHVGYQTAAENVELIQASGFRIRQHTPMERSWLQSPSVYTKAAAWEGFLGRLGRLGSRLGSGILFVPYAALMRAIDSTLGRLLPAHKGRIALVVAQRQQGMHRPHD
jgi:SAM-dependent methyltransferase